MGLDSFLIARKNNDRMAGGDVAYWRKANQIHAWFVKEVQDGEDDCGSYPVSRARLWDLLATCKEVMANRDIAPNLLPSQGGFFFGSTAYDEYYFEDIQSTIEQIEIVLNDKKLEDCSFEYHSSW